VHVVASALAASVALALFSPTAVAAVRGGNGIGDSYFPEDGNGGYDVSHYDVHDHYGIDSERLHGWTDVTLVPRQDLSRFNLDLMLTPDAVTVDGAPASFRKSDKHELVVTPAKSIGAGTTVTVRVRYHGRPGTLGFDGTRPWFANHHEAMATNEPQIAPWWFPANDHPRDKATYDITVSVPRGNQVLSNGELVSHTTGDTSTTWHWQMKQPMASYLAFFAAGRFRIESGTLHGFPYTIAVSKRFRSAVQTQQLSLLRQSSGVVSWLQSLFGPYPFTSTGGVVTSLYTGFALENQGRPTYEYLGSGHSAHTVLVHELAHQWFGDDISVSHWRDIWLNEGFASFVEWKYDETHGGTKAQTRLLRQYREHGAGSGFWKLKIANPGPARMFDYPVYDRGAMALQALRHRIGNRAFMTTLRGWVADKSYGNGSIGQFQAVAEQVSGQQLDGFFDAWLRSSTKPARTASNGLR
jgi:aminopeptidase N